MQDRSYKMSINFLFSLKQKKGNTQKSYPLKWRDSVSIFPRPPPCHALLNSLNGVT